MTDAYERAKTVRANVKAAGRCDIPASARAVLKVLAEYADPDGTHAFPAVATIAQQGSRGRKTVQRWLHWLVAEEYIEERGINRQHRTMEYALNLDLIYDNPLPVRGSARGAQGGCGRR